MNIQHSMETHKHNIRGSIVVSAIAATIVAVLALVCHSHATDGRLFCLSLGPGHIVGYLATLLMVYVIINMAKGARLDAQKLRALQG